MSITSERFDRATAVVETGVAAAQFLLHAPKDERPSAIKAHDAFIGPLRDDEDLDTERLLDLLGVAMMIIAFERSASGQSYLDYSRE